jgi:hypothetical protein
MTFRFMTRSVRLLLSKVNFYYRFWFWLGELKFHFREFLTFREVFCLKVGDMVMLQRLQSYGVFSIYVVKLILVLWR